MSTDSLAVRVVGARVRRRRHRAPIPVGGVRVEEEAVEAGGVPAEGAVEVRVDDVEVVVADGEGGRPDLGRGGELRQRAHGGQRRVVPQVRVTCRPSRCRQVLNSFWIYN